MIVEGTNFIESYCLAMSKEEFISRHMILFQSLDEEKRKKKLSKIYDKMKAQK